MKTNMIAISLACAAALAVPTAPALAKGSDEIRRAGNCSGSTDWELKAKARDGGIEVEYEVDSNRIGQKWRFTLKHNGIVVATGTRTTLAPSGSFTVERRVPNRAGIDSFVGTATNTVNGERCRGTLSF